MQTKFSKATAKGKLSPFDIEKSKVEISKQQLKIKEIEEDIEKAEKKLRKLK